MEEKETSRFAVLRNTNKFRLTLGDCERIVDDIRSPNAVDVPDSHAVGRKVSALWKRVLEALSLIEEISEYVAERSDREIAGQLLRLLPRVTSLYNFILNHKLASVKSTLYIAKIKFAIETLAEHFFQDVPHIYSNGNMRLLDRLAVIRIMDDTRTAMTDILACLHGEKAIAADTYDIKTVVKRANCLNFETTRAVNDFIVMSNDKELANHYLGNFGTAVEVLQHSEKPDKEDMIMELVNMRAFALIQSMLFVHRTVLKGYERQVGDKSHPSTNNEGDTNESVEVPQGTFETKAIVPVARLYKFLTNKKIMSGADKGKSYLNGNVISDRDFLLAVMNADYSLLYKACVRGKVRCVIILLSKPYFTDWREYRKQAAGSMGLSVGELTKYNVDHRFIGELKSVLPLID